MDFGTALTRPDFARFFAKTPKAAVPMPRWDDPATGTLEQRARAYLAVNCAPCHNPQGSASNSGLFLRWTDPEGVSPGIGKRPAAAGRASGRREVAITRPEKQR